MDATDPQGARARFLAAVSRLESEQDAPAHLCQACVEALPVQRAAVAVHVDGAGLEVLCASDRVAEQVEWAQITLGEGPGVDAVAAGGPMMVADLADPGGPWPTFAAEAVNCGVAALYALPLQVGAIRVGVLDLYRDTPGTLEAKDFADAMAVADLVTAILLTAGRTGRITESLGPWWDQPLSTREVHQATGMILAQLGVTAPDAYVRMQAFAYARGRMLSEVAHAVVHRRLRFGPDSDADPEEVADRL
ncbi:MAG TPA: GAF and ANTAR domain-containing protein [Mycobacterium sp.]|nr:GAF and ANTAR domain-containing protein [Mycobacterium sp.]